MDRIVGVVAAVFTTPTTKGVRAVITVDRPRVVTLTGVSLKIFFVASVPVLAGTSQISSLGVNVCSGTRTTVPIPEVLPDDAAPRGHVDGPALLVINFYVANDATIAIFSMGGY